MIMNLDVVILRQSVLLFFNSLEELTVVQVSRCEWLWFYSGHL